VKTTIIALSAAALIAAAPAVFAQGVASKTPGHEMQHKLSKNPHHGVSRYAPGRETQVKDSKRAYPGAFGYAPAPPRDYPTDDVSRNAGGGGGGGGY
jgi:hypothetical protein